VSVAAGDGRLAHHDVDRDTLRRVREQSRSWRAQLGIGGGEAVDEEATGWLLALAYPDRVAQRRAGVEGRYLMRNGLGAMLDGGGALIGAPFLSIADLDGRVPQSRIYLAAPLDRADLERAFAGQVVAEDVIAWDSATGSVRAERRERLGAIVLREAPLRNPDEAVVARVLLEALSRGDGLALRWGESAQRLRERIAFLHVRDAAWPDVSDAALRGSMEEWLLPRLSGLRRRSEVERIDPGALLLDWLTWEQRRALDELAPTHLTVPTGSRIPVDYGDPASPVLAVRLQELFGLADTPRLARGAVPVTLHLLSPARRPVQVTRDLAGFWRSSYFEVRKDLRGRYPKHEWPDDPLSATPTRRAKPRG
jgi:ATP-dependent helicase HrpB